MTDNIKRGPKMDRRGFLAGTAAAVAASQLVIRPGRADAAGWPEQPITLVVMYAAGGGTDVLLRQIGQEMAKAKGWDINVVNKAGAVGAVATEYVDGRDADGYTLLGAANYNKFVRVMGHTTAKPWEKWTYFQAANAVAAWSVPMDSQFKTFQDVVAFAKANPGKLTISTSGTGGIWHECALIVGSAAGIKLQYVPYKGGKPAALAGLQGEVDIAGGGVHEHIDLIRAGKFRCLQQTAPIDLEVEGVGKLPSVVNFLPKLKPVLPIGPQYNLVMKREVPLPVLKELKDAFVKAVASDSFKAVAKKNFFQVEVLTGDASDRKAALLEAYTAATFAEFADQIGAPVKSAAELGLPTPDDFDKWWPPQGYKPLDI